MADTYGHVVINGIEIPIQHVGLWNSECQITFVLPPGPAFRAPITVFGADGKGCWQGSVIEVPGRKFEIAFSYGLKTETIDATKVVDVTELPGWIAIE